VAQCARAFDIVQPDVTKVGGISEQRRIAWMADEFGVKYVGHGWNTALGVAADLQLASALPHTDLVEYIGGSAYVDGLWPSPSCSTATAASPFPNDRASASTLDPEKVARYAPDAGAAVRLGARPHVHPAGPPARRGRDQNERRVRLAADRSVLLVSAVKASTSGSRATTSGSARPRMDMVSVRAAMSGRPAVARSSAETASSTSCCLAMPSSRLATFTVSPTAVRVTAAA
jgi:hypothetical protein